MVSLLSSLFLNFILCFSPSLFPSSIFDGFPALFFIPRFVPRLFLLLSVSLLLQKIIFFLAFFTSPCPSFSYCSLFLTTLVFMALGSATHSLIPMRDTLLRGNEEFSSDDELPMSPRVLLKRLHINYWKIYKYP